MSQKKRNKKKPKRSFKFFFYMTFWLILLIFFTVAIAINLQEYNRLASSETQIYAQIEMEKQRGYQLQKDLTYHDSPAFYEKIAREELDLVKPDEIIFYNDAK